MFKTTYNYSTFFILLRAGLWGYRNLDVRINVSTDWNEVYELAQEQSVLGLVLAGLEHFDIKPPKVLLLQWIGEVQLIEQRGRRMNEFIALHYNRLLNEGINALLIKGQGIAQCYERPLWRASGDVDLLLDYNNYEKAKISITEVASNVMEEDPDMKHWDANVGDFEIELHGSLRSLLLPRMDKVIDSVQDDTFINNNIRLLNVNGVNVALPSINNDIIFVFTHIAKHFFHEGVGLRQICDLCRLLWSNKSEINEQLLKMRLVAAGIMTEWKAFAALAVDYLGMPVEAMPFYSDDKKWKRKAVRVMEFVLETGNFGHNRDYSYMRKYPYLVYKAISFWKHLKDGAFFFSIFPLDSIKVTWRRMVVGVSVVL